MSIDVILHSACVRGGANMRSYEKEQEEEEGLTVS